MEIPAIEHKVIIKASPAKVYEALTSAEILDTWFTDGAKVDARPGGEAHFRWVLPGPEPKVIEDSGPVLEAVPGVKYVFQWTPGKSTTTCSFEFREHEKGTQLVMTESGYTDDPVDVKVHMQCSVGWGEALTLLKVYLEHGIVSKVSEGDK